MKIAYLDCFAGISGDMTLGAFIDAGVDINRLKEELSRLGLHEFNITAEKVVKRGISATDVDMHIHHNHEEHHEHHHHHGRSYTEIKRIIEDSSLSDSVKKNAVAIFKRLGEAEAKIHGKDIEEIHFHEVGAVDAIVDIVGACICLDLMQIDKVYSSPIPTFYGTVEMAHGTFPLPAPATAEILKDAPWRNLGIEGEIVTPTGAAIAMELSEAFGAMPAMSVSSIGYGAGKKDFGVPNVLRVMIGETQEDKNHHEVSVVETNIDDLSPQVYEMVMERLFEAGALDVYMTPIQMKKNRPATLLSVICPPGLVDNVAGILFEETSTIGVRIDKRHRKCLRRRMVKVQTQYGEITLKIAEKDGRVVNAHPEYEDCKAAAIEHNIPVKLVRDLAIAAFYKEA